MAEIHGQWRTHKHELQDGALMPTVLHTPVLITKEWIRGWRMVDAVRKDYKRQLN